MHFYYVVYPVIGNIINESTLNVLSYLYRERSFIKLSETEADVDIYQFCNKLSSSSAVYSKNKSKKLHVSKK